MRGFRMTDFEKILATLRKEDEELARRTAQVRGAIRALTGEDTSPVPIIPRSIPKKVTKKKRRARKRKVSATVRKAASERMKQYWADKKKRTKRTSANS